MCHFCQLCVLGATAIPLILDMALNPGGSSEFFSRSEAAILLLGTAGLNCFWFLLNSITRLSRCTFCSVSRGRGGTIQGLVWLNSFKLRRILPRSLTTTTTDLSATLEPCEVRRALLPSGDQRWTDGWRQAAAQTGCGWCFSVVPLTKPND